jgi:hypothetical protein
MLYKVITSLKHKNNFCRDIFASETNHWYFFSAQIKPKTAQISLIIKNQEQKSLDSTLQGVSSYPFSGALSQIRVSPNFFQNQLIPSLYPNQRPNYNLSTSALALILHNHFLSASKTAQLWFKQFCQLPKQFVSPPTTHMVT